MIFTTLGNTKFVLTYDQWGNKRLSNNGRRWTPLFIRMCQKEFYCHKKHILPIWTFGIKQEKIITYRRVPTVKYLKYSCDKCAIGTGDNYQGDMTRKSCSERRSDSMGMRSVSLRVWLVSKLFLFIFSNIALTTALLFFKIIPGIHMGW